MVDIIQSRVSATAEKIIEAEASRKEGCDHWGEPDRVIGCLQIEFGQRLDDLDSIVDGGVVDRGKGRVNTIVDASFIWG